MLRTSPQRRPGGPDRGCDAVHDLCRLIGLLLALGGTLQLSHQQDNGLLHRPATASRPVRGCYDMAAAGVSYLRCLTWLPGQDDAGPVLPGQVLADTRRGCRTDSAGDRSAAARVVHGLVEPLVAGRDPAHRKR
jgi:hypothetical protein